VHRALRTNVRVNTTKLVSRIMGSVGSHTARGRLEVVLAFSCAPGGLFHHLTSLTHNSTTSGTGAVTRSTRVVVKHTLMRSRAPGRVRLHEDAITLFIGPVADSGININNPMTGASSTSFRARAVCDDSSQQEMSVTIGISTCNYNC
jgi:hypothetical protein